MPNSSSSRLATIFASASCAFYAFAIDHDRKYVFVTSIVKEKPLGWPPSASFFFAMS